MPKKSNIPLWELVQMLRGLRRAKGLTSASFPEPAGLAMAKKLHARSMSEDPNRALQSLGMLTHGSGGGARPPSPATDPQRAEAMQLLRRLAFMRDPFGGIDLE